MALVRLIRIARNVSETIKKQSTATAMGKISSLKD